MSAQPNQTLYVQNLGDKVSLSLAEELEMLTPIVADQKRRQVAFRLHLHGRLYMLTVNVLADLRRLLYQLFSAHGKVLDVVATRAPGMGGQAFIVFKDLQSATAARRKEDGTAFLGKAMVCLNARLDAVRFQRLSPISLPLEDTICKVQIARCHQRGRRS